METRPWKTVPWREFYTDSITIPSQSMRTFFRISAAAAGPWEAPGSRNVFLATTEDHNGSVIGQGILHKDLR